MEQDKRYELLESLPAYGPIHKTITQDGKDYYYSEGFVVRFYKIDGTDWVANFEPGWTGLEGIYPLQGQALLVIAGGRCYIMNPTETKPISTFGVDYEVIFIVGDGRFVLQDGVRITVVESNGEHWSSERISWDGMKDLQLAGNIISGLSWDALNNKDEWVRFTFNIDTGLIMGGSWKKYIVGKKPWWKFWA